ncbi:MAG: hypothetical protein JWM56_1071 [Candidatus Peribacteria bacterium]|nr:hypothetical protein [Candidatus Peribacteria bacterium]
MEGVGLVLFNAPTTKVVYYGVRSEIYAANHPTKGCYNPYSKNFQPHGALDYGVGFDANRRSDMATILNALALYKTDSGSTLDFIPAQPTEICKFKAPDCKNLVNLDVLVTQHYVESIPADPLADKEPDNTFYTIQKDAAGTITVAAPKAVSVCGRDKNLPIEASWVAR